MYDLLYNNLLWTEGSFVLFVLLTLGSLGLLVYRPLFWATLIGGVFSLYFFRNPERMCEQALSDDRILLCPADGTVVDIQFDSHNQLQGYAQKVSIFLSPFDAHVMWASMTGEIEKISYVPGKFAFAFLPKSSEFNERNDIILRNKDNKTIQIRQIAGLFARRICCWVYAGQQLIVGHKYGMIRFGSRVDVFLPSSVTLHVSIGQKVLGGCTILGYWQ